MPKQSAFDISTKVIVMFDRFSKTLKQDEWQSVIDSDKLKKQYNI